MDLFCEVYKIMENYLGSLQKHVKRSSSSDQGYYWNVSFRCCGCSPECDRVIRDPGPHDQRLDWRVVVKHLPGDQQADWQERAQIHPVRRGCWRLVGGEHEQCHGRQQTAHPGQRGEDPTAETLRPPVRSGRPAVRLARHCLQVGRAPLQNTPPTEPPLRKVPPTETPLRKSPLWIFFGTVWLFFRIFFKCPQRVPPSRFLIFCNRMYANKSRRVPPFTFFSTMQHFSKEKKFKNFKFFPQKKCFSLFEP